MRIHYLKHVPFEGLGSMENMFVERGCSLSRTCMYEDQSLPSIHDIDALVVMGGPMGVGDDDEYPWLTLEKEFIESMIKREVPVLGVCLGAQLIANVLGAEVSKNVHEEIGWFPVKRTKGLIDERVENLPISFDALHWHGDTFDIPEGGHNFMTSEACANQGFAYGDSTLALQFHLEMLPSDVQTIYQECGNPEKNGAYIHGLADMLAPADKFQRAGKILEKFLEAFIFQKTTQLLGE
ncbi:MAG: type 1 glutamine amidotransferase [Gammaproteobacteria bacterium]|nr:type 1 glutamine amidotransferase [Gammaproteobacteria bacterium]